jgi:hypothetical protein
MFNRANKSTVLASSAEGGKFDATGKHRVATASSPKMLPAAIGMIRGLHGGKAP